MSTCHIGRLLSPRSLTIVGAGPRSGWLAGAVLASVEVSGFPGRIAEGLQRLTGQVLVSNIKMLQMCRALGFSVRTDSDDADVCDVSSGLDRPVSRTA